MMTDDTESGIDASNDDRERALDCTDCILKVEAHEHNDSVNFDEDFLHPHKEDHEDTRSIISENSRSPVARTKDFGNAISCCGMVERPTFFKGCKWSPDDIGNRILICDGRNRLTIFHTFLNKLDYKSSQISDDKYEISNIGNVYDFDWYPLATASQYYVVAATSLGPIHMFDASTSKSIASYHMYNTNDEMIHARSVTCVTDGSRLISGTSDYLFLFDINRPGRTYERIQTRSNFNRGIISTIAAHPQRCTMFAVGTYNNRIGIYDERDLLCLLFGHSKGLTHMKFSPDGVLLYSGTRGNGDIFCWDLRNPGTALYRLERKVRTQQRMYFDITSNSRYILSGSTDGDVHVWDSLVPPVDTVLPPVHTFLAHRDCTNGLSIHSRLPFVATVSGQYHYSDTTEDCCSDQEEIIENNIWEENALKLWYVEL